MLAKALLDSNTDRDLLAPLPSQNGPLLRREATEQLCLVCRVNGNLNLSRAIGDLKYKSNDQLTAAEQIISAQPDVTEIKLGPQDRFLVLACDGVWDVKTNQVTHPFSLPAQVTNLAPDFANHTPFDVHLQMMRP